MKNNILSATILMTLGSVATIAAQAATLNNGDILHITPGVATYDANSIVTAFSGSYFAVDGSAGIADGKITNNEKQALAQGPDGGIIIGAVQSASGSHSGAPNGTEDAHIDAPWYYFGNTGMDYTTTAVTGDTVSGLDMSGWTIMWNGTIIPLSGAWQPLNCSSLGCTGHTFTAGNGWLRWDGVYGDNYQLDYAAILPQSDPSCFCEDVYYLHLEGTVSAVPLPPAAWLFGSGTMGLLGLGRWRRGDFQTT